ncbi:MAG: hypothetical protein SFX73_07545 [Kofleriaceae bacterium]|nr:hypothetical protein [Kofleriaceae bacterium]
MRALWLMIAMLLSQACAPASLGSATSALANSGDLRTPAERCNTDLNCGGGGSSSSVAIPVLIIITALTVPAALHYYVFRSDAKRTSPATSRPAE